MTGLGNLIIRNCKLFFKDKGMFFTSLITPLILLVLYATFLANIYRESFASALPMGFVIDEALIDATVGGQLASSILAVSCVTVAFCSNLLMVQDKVSGAITDLTVTPVKRSTIAVGYFCASSFATIIINFVALAACLIYLYFTGWYMSAADVMLTLLDVVLLTLFGISLSSCINFFLSTSGQGSAVGTIISAGYGFLCGAYMPISSFSEGLQRVLSFLPGTYGTSLIRNHCMRGVFAEMANIGFPAQAIEGIKDSIDCNLYFYGENVSVATMYAVLCTAILVFVAIYVALNIIFGKKN